MQNNVINLQIIKDAKPCPFCGRKEIVTGEYKKPGIFGNRYTIFCSNCTAEIDPGWAKTREVVIEMWNRRNGGK